MRAILVTIAGALRLGLCLATLTALPPVLLASDGPTGGDTETQTVDAELDDLLDPFDEDPPIADPAAAGRWSTTTGRPQRCYHMGGEVSLSAAANIAHEAPLSGQTDWRGLSRLRSRLAVEFDADPSDRLAIHASGYGFYDLAYGINGRDGYTDAVLDGYESEWELTETFVLLTPIASVDARFGRQVVVWGNSDNIRVTDILNPLDLREPGLTDLEYMRLPVTLSRLDAYLNPWQMAVVAIHEIRFDKTPVYGSDYFPHSQPLPPEDVPADAGGNTEWALSLKGTFSGWDLALYAADHYDDQAHLEMAAGGPLPEPTRRHARLTMLGTAANLAVGNWLLKAEVAWQDGFEFFNTPDQTFSRTDLLAGIEYTGFRETTIGVEVANRHINGFQYALRQAPDLAQPDTFQSAVRIVRDFLNDTLTCTLLAMTYGTLGEDGALQRVQAEYDLRDNLEITGGVVFYQSGNRQEFESIGDNDRVFAELAYHF